MKRNSVAKWGMFVLLAACMLLLAGCAGTPAGQRAPAGQTAGETQEPDILPNIDENIWDEQRQTVTLYYRMRDESMLAQETRQVIVPRDKQFERVLIEALIEGPSAGSIDLTGLFINGTRVVDVNVTGTVLTVTLSFPFLGTPVDAPVDWQNDPAWHSEVLLRRRLALASIVSTVTEETTCTSVQLLVQPDANYPAGQRIARSNLYEDATDDDQLLTPVARNEDEMLTHYNTAKIILDSYMEKDYARLHRFVANRPTEAAFTDKIASIARSLVAYWVSPGTVSPDGQEAVLIAHLDFTGRDDTAFLEEYPIQLVRERGIWKIDYDALLRMLEAS